MEAWEAKILFVIWGMGKVRNYILQCHYLNFILEFRVVEASSDQREFAIWISQGLL